MKSATLGTDISTVEVTLVSTAGFWLLADGREYFLDFTEYPWFRDVRVSELTNVRLLHGNHLHWPDLDVDLELDTLTHPESYPLVYR